MPSHTITMTRTTTTTSSGTALILNTGYLKGVNGILKLLELIIGIIIVGILSYYITNYSQYRVYRTVDLYFLLVSVACLITTFLLLLSALISIATATILPKTVFEYFYHGAAFLLYLTASIAFLTELVKRNDHRGYKEEGYEAMMSAAVLGLINAGLYLFSAIMAHRVYKIG